MVNTVHVEGRLHHPWRLPSNFNGVKATQVTCCRTIPILSPPSRALTLQSHSPHAHFCTPSVTGYYSASHISRCCPLSAQHAPCSTIPLATCPEFAPYKCGIYREHGGVYTSALVRTWSPTPYIAIAVAAMRLRSLKTCPGVETCPKNSLLLCRAYPRSMRGSTAQLPCYDILTFSLQARRVCVSSLQFHLRQTHVGREGVALKSDAFTLAGVTGRAMACVAYAVQKSQYANTCQRLMCFFYIAAHAEPSCHL